MRRRTNRTGKLIEGSTGFFYPHRHCAIVFQFNSRSNPTTVEMHMHGLLIELHNSSIHSQLVLPFIITSLENNLTQFNSVNSVRLIFLFLFT